MVQLAPCASTEPQLLVCAKSTGFNHVLEILPIARFAAPVLVSTPACAGRVVPTSWFVKLRLETLRLTAGKTALPIGEFISDWICVCVNATLYTRTSSMRPAKYCGYILSPPICRGFVD